MDQLRITVWNEYRHEKANPKVAEVYPRGIHDAIAEGLRDEELAVRTATLDEPEQGLPQDLLDETDVLFWWGHKAHKEVTDRTVARVCERVLGGMGLVVLHSAHMSKVFRALMGTSCRLSWREAGERERLWVVEPGHPIAAELPMSFVVPHSEMYGERFDIPAPDELVFLSWYQGGEVFRSGCCFHRGAGRIFYFSPGHETYPIYYQPEVRQVLLNAAFWAAPGESPEVEFGERPEPLEEIEDERPENGD